jgi:hypothetical protein
MSELKLVRSRLLQKIFEQTKSGGFPVAEARTRLEAGEDLLTVARGYDLIDEQSESHFRADWFTKGGYWGERDVDGVIRRGFIEALGMAETLNAPIAGYWLSGAEDLAVPVLPSPVQVTLLVLTPPFPRPLEEGRSNLFQFEVELAMPGIHNKA